MNHYELVRDEVQAFDTPRGCPGVFHLRLLEARFRRPVAICGELTDNPGPSITNAMESVAARVAEVLGTRRFRLIEHYPWWWGSPNDEPRPSYSLVTFSGRSPKPILPPGILVVSEAGIKNVRPFPSEDSFQGPRWSTPMFSPQEFLGRGVELRCWAPCDYTAEAVGGRRAAELRDRVALDAREWVSGLEAVLQEHGLASGDER